MIESTVGRVSEGIAKIEALRQFTFGHSLPTSHLFVFRLGAFPRDLVATCRKEKHPISDGNHGGKFNRRGVDGDASNSTRLCNISVSC
jgi:hypothetical protein